MTEDDMAPMLWGTTSSPVQTALSVLLFIAALGELAIMPAIVIAVWRWALQ